MRKNTRWLLMLCITAIAGVFLLQFFWIRNYYQVNKATFEKEVNLVFEDALKKEFEVRCDTIEHHILNTLLDTGKYLLYVEFDAKKQAMMFHIVDRDKLTDNYAFHSDSLVTPVTISDMGPAKIRIARYLAHIIRGEDLAKHMTWYRTQKFGTYLEHQERIYDFDTARLRPILRQKLAVRGIATPFVFYTRSVDSTYNKSTFNNSITNAYPVITKSFLTYKSDKNQHYIRAMFSNPLGYIITKMGAMFLASLVLIGVVAFSLFYLLRSLLTEKKLALIKNDFISNITHELKTPIATVSAAVESLSDFDVLEDKEKTARYLAHSKNELQRLSGLVNTILTSTLYENPAFECNYEQFDTDEAIHKIVATYQFNSAKPVAIRYQNQSGIDALNADKMLFNQSLENVLDNAVKYSGDEVKIDINCRLENGFFVIRIKDNGAGIAKESLPFLFEKFYRVPTNAHKIKGHGLGLNFVKSIMERHQGWCRAESRLGNGTTLILGWPV